MSIIPFIVAAIFLTIAFRSKRSAKFKAKTWVTATGKIIEIKSYWTTRKHYAPFITFYTLEHQQFYFNGKGSQRSLYQPGQLVEVVYNPLNPNQAEIKYDPSDSEMITLRLFVGGLFLFFALILFVIDLIILFGMILTLLGKNNFN